MCYPTTNDAPKMSYGQEYDNNEMEYNFFTFDSMVDIMEYMIHVGKEQGYDLISFMGP